MKKKKKIIYIIPGYEESHKQQSSYKKIARIFEKVGMQIIHIEIDWHYQKPRSFKGYVEQFLKQYKKPNNTEVFILGFSYGATIAFLAESKIKAKAMILCSLSPYFKEDMKNLKKSWIQSWKKDFTDSDYLFSDLAKHIKTKTYLLVGKKEPKACLTRARSAKRRIGHSELTLIDGAKHDIGQTEYLETLKRLAQNL